jgi:hypothetical protein
MTHLNFHEICKLLREAFPDETVKDGQRLTKAQAGILNRCIVEIKARDARLAAFRVPLPPPFILRKE